jgi:hypothetical protein
MVVYECRWDPSKAGKGGPLRAVFDLLTATSEKRVLIITGTLIDNLSGKRSLSIER